MAKTTKIEFITKQTVKSTEPVVSIFTTGSDYHKIARFSFRNGTGQKISKTGYIVVSNIDENSEKIYFNESVKNEGYAFIGSKANTNGAISINAHWLAVKLEEYEWVGDYLKIHKEDGYYCIHKSDRVGSISKKTKKTTDTKKKGS